MPGGFLRDSLATAYQQAGRFHEARPLLEQPYADRNREHGAGDSRSLRTADELAAVYRATGRVEPSVRGTARIDPTGYRFAVRPTASQRERPRRRHGVAGGGPG
ncbi:tetratricopeptide repeat protein [Frankia sp. QA3]|uniref:tetratricopeptide repeat protein n=1 Tax=Frankia sp. QA3 TaxID=710111 RepID=UPI0012FA7A31